MVTVCAKALTTVKATMLSSEATTTCTHAVALGIRKLRRFTRQMTKSVKAPRPRLHVRMLSGGISLSATFINGQLTPQMRHKMMSMSRA